jgi:hypothetical protein
MYSLFLLHMYEDIGNVRKFILYYQQRERIDPPFPLHR